MQFYRLTPAFFADYANGYTEILTKQTRPYYVLLVNIHNLTFAIPLRSHLPADRRFAFVADGGDSGLDFVKSVVITDPQRHIESMPIKIRQHEFQVLQQNEFKVNKAFERFLKAYIKQSKRILKNPAIPKPYWCSFSSLQYFHAELGIDS